MAKDRSSRI